MTQAATETAPPPYKLFVIDYPPNDTFGKHIDFKPRISIVLSGNLREVVGKQEEIATPMSLVVKPSYVYHSNKFGPKGARLLSLEFSPQAYDQLQADAPLAHWQWHREPEALRAAFQLFKQYQQGFAFDEIEDLLPDFFAALSPLPNPKGTPPRWLDQFHQQLRQAFAQPLQVKDLAQEWGVHPVYLARIFRQYYGCSIKTFLINRRIYKAMDELTNSNKSITHIALDCGFSDQSHLTRTLRESMGESPAAFRKVLKF